MPSPDDEQPSVPPGWYSDPKMVGTQRYWDGTQWSEHAVPMNAEPQRADYTQIAAKLFVAVVAVALLLGAVWLVTSLLTDAVA